MRLVRALVVLALAASCFVVRTDASAAVSLTAVMSGGQEVPAGSGDADGSGRTDLVVSVKKKTICFTVQYSAIDAPTAGHIHEADAGAEGPIVVTLFSSAPGLPSGSQDCLKEPRRLVKEIRDHFTHFYVNFHNASFPDGAIRGQLDFGS